MSRFFMTLTIAIVGFISAVASAQTDNGSEISLSEIQAAQEQVEEFERAIIEVLQTQGTQALTRYLRLRAEDGLDLSPLRAWVFEQNKGSPEIIRIPIPKGGERLIEFANEQLQLSGIDFFRLEGVVDLSLPPYERPIQGQDYIYERWRLSRTLALPFFGFAVTLLEMSRGLARPELIASLARAFAVFGFEVQASFFSAQWNRLWSKEQPLLTWRLDVERSKLKELSRLINRFLELTEGITVGHFYNFLAKWANTVLIYMVHFLALKKVRPGTRMPLLKLIGDSWIINMGVFVSYGIPQVALGHSFKRGEISELLRYQVETILEAWSDFWRLASLAPRFRFLGNLMLYGAGALIAVPFLMKNAGADDYARHTALIYFWNRLPNEDIELKERWLSRVYDSFMLTRDASLE